MGQNLRPLLLPLLVGLVLVTLAGGAHAHAALVSSEPPRNSQLDAAPSQLVLHFSEPFEDEYTHVHVHDEEGERYDRDNVFEGGNTRIRVPLAPMPDGLYFVYWRTLGTDTHTLEGQYLLAVNVTFDRSEIPADSGAGRNGVPSEGFGAEVAVRTVGFLAGSLAAGISLFVLVLPRDHPLDAARRAHHRLTAIAGGVAALAALLLLFLIGRRIDGTLLDAAGTDSGTWIALRGTAFALAGGVAWATERWGGQERRDDWFAALAGLAGLVATTMSSHAAAEPSLRGLAITADLLHLVAVAFWLGGLALLAILVARRTEASALQAAVRRFSPLAILAVLVIIITGALASGLRILGLSDLTETIYGRALLLKILLLVPLIVLGAVNRFHVQPRLSREEPERAARGLRRNVLAEMLIMVVTLVAAGTLATVAPPDALGTPEADGFDPDKFRGIVSSFEAERHRFTVRVLPDPLTLGPQELIVEVERLEGATAEVRDIILIRRTPAEGPDAEGEAVPLAPEDDGTWRLDGFLFPDRGTWHNDLLVQGRGIYHVQHVPMHVA